MPGLVQPQDRAASVREMVARGPVRPGERALAPDLARGGMLLLIVLSTTGFHLWAASHGASGWHPVGGSALDRVVQLLMITVLDLRVYPLFAFLFGYGMMQLYLRQTAAGTSERAAVALLRRRSLWLGWLFLRRAEGTLLVWGAIAAVLVAWTMTPAVAAVVSGDLGLLGHAPTEPTTVVYASGQENALAATRTRLGTWLFVTLAGGTLSVGGHAAMLLGLWAARRRVLEEPHHHLRMLRWTAVLGMAIGWLGRLPAALAHVGVLEVPPAAVSEQGAPRLIADGTGLAGGLGYVALFGLIAYRIPAWARRHPAVVAVAAVGKRSLSCYLAHSLLFAPLLAAWGLGLGALLGSATMAAFAVGVWLVTVAGAYAMERAEWRGPAEVLLRRLTYGTAGRGGGRTTR